MFGLRVLIGLAVTALLATGLWSVVQQVGASSELIAGDAPGISEPDRRALAAPIEDVLAGRDAALLGKLVGELDRNQAQEQIDLIQAMMPAASPESSRLTTWRVTRGTNGQALYGTFEYEFPDHIMVAETTLARTSDSDPWLVSGFYFNFFERSALPPPGISLEDRALGFYAFIAALAAIPVFILITFWAALLWPRVRRRWLWSVAVLIGVGTFAVNATTGAASFNIFSFLLFGAAATWSGSMLDSWVLSIAAPAGAIAFWLVHFLAPPRAPVDDAAAAPSP